MSDWDADAQADFESRLGRARDHNRPQYLRIKALALREAGHKQAAATLLGRVLEEYPASFDAGFCAELLGELAAESGDWHAAEAWYRESLRLRPDQHATTGEAHIGLAEALVGQARHLEAVEALNSFFIKRLTLNHVVCRWNAVLAVAAHGVGDYDVAAEAADRSLALLNAPDQFSRHRGVGRAVLSEEQASRLTRLASHDHPSAKPRGGLFRR